MAQSLSGTLRIKFIQIEAPAPNLLDCDISPQMRLTGSADIIVIKQCGILVVFEMKLTDDDATRAIGV